MVIGEIFIELKLSNNSIESQDSKNLKKKWFFADYYDTTVNPSTEFWAKTKAKAKEELFSASGSLFDPDVVKAFIDVLG